MPTITITLNDSNQVADINTLIRIKEAFDQAKKEMEDPEKRAARTKIKDWQGNVIGSVMLYRNN